MSYERKGNVYEHTCVVCSQKFNHKLQIVKTCSNKCRKIRNKMVAPKSEINEFDLQCVICETSFKHRYKHTKTCSEECRKQNHKNLSSKYEYMKPREQVKLDKIKCATCNDTFQPSSPSNKYCSIECRPSFYSTNTKSKDIYIPSIKPFQTQSTVFNRIPNGWLTSSSFTPELRERVLKRDGYRCYICSAETRLHVHHIVPRIQGGQHREENLITLCAGCHRSIESGDTENAIIKCTERAINNI